MNTRDFLLEIGTEEIPARCVDQLRETLEQDLEGAFLKAGLTFKKPFEFLSTYRRLAVRFSEVPEFQADREEVLTGPPLAVAKNENGEWLPSALGFAKKAGVSLEQLENCVGKDAKGREVLSYTKRVKGESTLSVLSTLVPQVLQDLALPVAMRWGNNDKTFYRPVQWIVCLFGQEIVPFSFFEAKSGNISRGHRFLTQNDEGSILGKACLIPSPREYCNVLKVASVISDSEDRKDSIFGSIAKFGQLHLDDALLKEVVNLVEYPEVLVGQFSDTYLEVPSEVLSKTMMSHQRYFPIYSEGVLTNRFAVVAENVRTENKATIIAGNERVLVARLEDAKFFYNEDKKKPLDQYVGGLKNVTFQKGMGSLFDKKERVKLLATHIAGLVGFSDLDLLERAGELCKADLVTHMVYEFPELQGIMGDYYARLSGEPQAVCQAIREHYFPLSSSAPVPSSTLACILALSDRIDTIVVTYQNGLIPTGSKDPLGIRRAMLSLLKIETQCGFSLNFIELFKKGYDILGKGEGNFDALLSFFVQRVQNFIGEEAGVSYDIAQSVTNIGLTRLHDAIQSAKELFVSKLNDPQFKSFVETAVRVNRLAKHAEANRVDVSLFQLEIESKVWALCSSLQRPYSYKNLLTLIEPLTVYFNDVMVMVDDVQLKKNRLAFLSEINHAFLSYSDFEKIVIGS